MSTLRVKIEFAPVAVALILPLLLSGCVTKTETEDDNSSNTFVTIVSMQAAAGQATTAEGTDLFSDVCTAVGTSCSVTNDNGFVEMRANIKDVTNPSTFKNDVVFERYRVTYIRADGRNVPGVDVPFPFDGVANFIVPVGGDSVIRAFIVVRHQAKLEPPLVQLKQVVADGGGGGALILSTIAQIDFFGRDVAGRSIKVTGFLNVMFANFADDP